ncbi:MAG: flagellar basal body L-ring protein FlgH [Pseudomonadota bacterium]
MRNSKTLIALPVAAMLLTGCVVNLGRGPDYSPPEPMIPETAAPTDGAIYQADLDVRLFEDLRARRVGDILTIRLQESTSANKSSSTTAGKSSSADFASPSVLGQNVTRDGIEILSGQLSGSSQFNGEGNSSQSNSLDGNITVTVVKRLANGNLLIRGEKWVTLNQGDEFIRLSGIIRPFDIEPDNSVDSSRVADARITYSSKGVLAAANKMGLLQRFVQSVWFPN